MIERNVCHHQTVLFNSCIHMFLLCVLLDARWFCVYLCCDVSILLCDNEETRRPGGHDGRVTRADDD